MEKIEIIGTECKKLKILYLQNNIINKIENLKLLKDLEYLNLALNNISKIENVKCCEFLRKLDLTVNFIDLDNLEESVKNLKDNIHLKELYMNGNPCDDWEGCRDYIIHSLPQLKQYNGIEITRSDAIRAKQRFDQLEIYVRDMAPRKRMENLKRSKEVKNSLIHNTSEMSEHAPEVRTEMYREIGEQKEKEERRKKEMLPKERDYEREHEDSVETIRLKERSSSKVLQCNQGRWEFEIREDDRNNLILDLHLSKHIVSSLIDVDVQPTYCSIIIKNKIFRLEWPEEVKADLGKAERSQASGHLL